MWDGRLSPRATPSRQTDTVQMTRLCQRARELGWAQGSRWWPSENCRGRKAFASGFGYSLSLILPASLAIMFNTLKSRSVKSPRAAGSHSGGRQTVARPEPTEAGGSQADCIRFLGCYNKVITARWIKATEIESLRVLKPRSLKSMCWQGHTSEGSREDPS